MLTRLALDLETENFKWWPRLHGFWRTLPNFNPYTVSSDPGQDLANEAHSVLMGGRTLIGSDLVCCGVRVVTQTDLAAIQDEDDLPPLFPETFPVRPDDTDDDILAFSGSTPARPDHTQDDTLASSTPRLSTPLVTNHMVKAEAAPTGRTPSSLTKSKTSAKRTSGTVKDVTEVFAEGSIRDARTVERLGTQKHERALGELELRRRRIDQKTLDRRHQRER